MTRNIFGKNSPININWEENKQEIYDYFITDPIDKSLIKELENDKLIFNKDEIIRLKALDAYLDISVVQVIVEKNQYKK